MLLPAQAPILAPFLKKMRSVKFFFIVSFTSLFCSLLWVQLTSRENVPVNEDLIAEAIKNVGHDLRYRDVYRKSRHLPKNLKYILLWTHRDYAPFSFLENGQRSFLKNNCPVVNCYVTANRKFFGQNYTKFHAIAFNGRTMRPYDNPPRRSPHQKYIFFNMESSETDPVCYPIYDGFFNLTATYKLHSDIPLPYILIKDMKGNHVGPKSGMKWIENMSKVGDNNVGRIGNKTKAAAWFVSHCTTQSKREDFVKELQDALYPYGYTVDVFGKCGQLNCPRFVSDCGYLLKRDYFFYLSLENSFAEDYVTEKLLTALNHDVVPVVFGGADYSKFLPPGSYIDGRKQSMYQLAAIMDRLTHSPEEYRQFFSWKSHYTYYDSSATENICSLCKVLNDKSVMEKSTVYENFRYWWNPNYRRRC